MDSVANFAAQTAAPRKASLFDRLDMRETLRSTNTSTAVSRMEPLLSSSLLERILSAMESDYTAMECPEFEGSTATGCSPTVYSTTRPMRRKRGLSQATAAPRSNDLGADLKPSLLSRLEGENVLETHSEGPQEPGNMLKIKGSAAVAQPSQDMPSPSFASSSRHRRGRGHQSLMNRMRVNEGKECV